MPGLKAKRYILTFPQNATTKETVTERLLAKWPSDLEWSIVAEEKHEDGTPHLHAIVVFKEQKNITMDAFDFLAEKHGNYQPVKHLAKAVEYVTKDKAFLCHNIDPETILAKKGQKTAIIAKKLKDGATIYDIDAEYPEFILTNKRKVQEYIQFLEEAKRIKEVPPPAEYLIHEYFTLKIGTDLPFRSKQLYLYGEPGIGKTTLIRKLCEKHRGYAIPSNNDFQHYNDDLYDFAFFDEFKGQLTPQFLNQWLDGQLLPLNTKGSSYIKKKNIPTIILSNLNLISVYKETVYIEATIDRLTIIEVKRADIERILLQFN